MKIKTTPVRTQRLFRRQSVNCTTVTRKHPRLSQSPESWYGLIVRCYISRESRTDDVAAVKAMELFEALYVERWLQAKGPSKAKARVPSMTANSTLRWQRQGNFQAK
jgi:hypothetical protein